jgi:hypothetical protein
MKFLPRLAALPQQGAERFLGFCHHMEKQMTKMTFMSAALIAATVFATQAMAARNDSAARHATAPNVGAFASNPYTVPPCLPNNVTDTFQ